MCFGVQNELFTGPRDPVVPNLRFGTTGPDPGTYITVPPITSEGPWNPGMEEVHNLRTTVLLVFHRLPVRVDRSGFPEPRGFARRGSWRPGVCAFGRQLLECIPECTLGWCFFRRVFIDVIKTLKTLSDLAPED